MTAKHTRGPWAIRDDDEDGVVSIVGSSRIVLARVRTATVEPGDENARLISAAPELLDELIEQDKFIGVLAGTVPISEKDTHRRIAMHRESGRAAIAKAIGN